MLDDDELAGRIRGILSLRDGCSERRMFGGVCFMINGNMCAGTSKGSLLVRLDPKRHDETLAEPHTRPAEMAGRTMKGWALVEPGGIQSDRDLESWLDRTTEFAGSLPAK